ncbi:Cysteine desulfurase, mitosomal [Dictyocoela muelleri]|nr:Cysteine desulfurase, mitosomal [Dictyocoela muelleri]
MLTKLYNSSKKFLQPFLIPRNILIPKNFLNSSLNLPSSLKQPYIYMDYQSTTPVDPRVISSMLPYFSEKYGNPHSRTHRFGWESEKAVSKARLQLSRLINCAPDEIIFTSGATESNNLAIKGLVNFKRKKFHIITTQIEHKCVLDSCRFLETQGHEVTYLPVNKEGIVDLEQLRNSIKENTVLVSVMAVNNEMGAIQPLEEIGKICKEKEIVFHSDAAQAVGKIPIDVEKMNLGMVSISGHKIYGPKGVGALYIRKKPRVRLSPLFSGGGQERGYRSGTVPTPLVVGIGKAAEIARKTMKEEGERIKNFSFKLLNSIKKHVNVIKNGSMDLKKWFPGCLNISFPHVEGESLMMKLKNIALSSGSACTSASLEPSYVLRALGTDDELAHSSIRFGIGRFTTNKEIKKVAKETVKAVKELQAMSPLYEMEKEGIDLKSIDWTA